MIGLLFRALLLGALCLGACFGTGFSAPASAQMLKTIVAAGSAAGGGSSYVGPGDVKSGAFFWIGLRAYSAATVGTSAIDLRRDDAATCTVSTDSNGNLDVTVATPCGGSTVTAWMSGHTATISKFYNKGSAGGDFANATTASQASFGLTCSANSKPCFTIPGSNTVPYTSASTFTQSLPITIVAAFKDASTAAGTWINAANTSGPQVLLDDTSCAGGTRKISIYDGSAAFCSNAAYSSATWYVWQGVVNGASSSQTLNNAGFGTGTVGVAQFVGGKVSLGNHPSVNVPVAVTMTEMGQWPAAFNGTELSNMDGNLRAYWGF